MKKEIQQNKYEKIISIITWTVILLIMISMLFILTYLTICIIQLLR